MSGRTAKVTLKYQPMLKQAEAHRLTSKYKSFCGGWGNGKTSWGCVETYATLMEFPGTNCIVARKTRPELKATTWDMLLNGDPTGADDDTSWQGLPKETIKVYNKSDLYIEFHNGSKIHGLPLDDPKKLENYNLGFFWIDQAEEVEEDIFLKFNGRLRQIKGPREGILTWNPHGHGWLWKRFIDPDRSDKWKRLYSGVEATTYDNPNLPDDYLDQFHGLPEAWLQRFVQGSHDVFVGQIFTDWDEELHVIQPFRIPSHWPRYMCIDPGIRHEAAISWVAMDFEGNKYYYREHLESDQPVEWWASRIYELEEDDDYGGPEESIEVRLIGPESQQRAQTDGKSVRDLFAEYGIYTELADRDPGSRISEVTSHLRPLVGHRNPFTGDEPAPRLYVFATCNKMLEYLPQYRWRPTRINFTEEEAPEKPRKKDDHNIDNLGHILLHIQGLPELPAHRPSARTERELLEENLDLELAAAESGVNGDLSAHDVLGAY